MKSMNLFWVCALLAGMSVTRGADSFAAAGEPVFRDFFVNQAHPQADDDNPGTREAPWLTIGGNLDQLRAGDTVHVKEGTYREEMIASREPWDFFGNAPPVMASGESYSRMISFAAWPGHEVVIKGSDVVGGWEHYRDEVWVRAEWPPEEQRVRIRGWPAGPQQVFADGKLLRQTAGEMAGGEDGYLMKTLSWQGRRGDGLEDLEPGSFYYDRDEHNIYIWLEDGGDPNDHLVEVSVRGFFFFLRGINYVRISGFRMTHANTSAVINWAALNLGGSHNILENLDVTWTDYCGARVGRFGTVLNSRFNHHGNQGLDVGSGSRIINSETSHNNYRDWGINHHAGGMKLVGYPHDIIVSGHTAAYNRGHAIWFDWGMSNITIENSVVHGNTGFGIFYEAGERGVIRNNIVYRNHLRGIYVADSADTLVAHNLSVENGLSGIVVIGTSRGAGRHPIGREEDNVLWVRNNMVWGNIVGDNGHPDLYPELIKRYAWMEGRPRRAELIMPDDRPTNRNNISDHNLFYRSDGERALFWTGYHVDEYDDLTDWQEEQGYDRNSIVARPIFMDRAARDYRPAPGSPAIGLVRPQMSVRYDLNGRERRRLVEAGGYYTAGPFEYESE